MINDLVGLYLTENFDIKADRIVFTETVSASNSTSITLANALNGAAVIAELNTYDYFLTKYTTWTSKGLMQVEIKPDDESINKVKTLSFTQKIESLFTPPKYVQTNITVNLDNRIALENDVYLIIDLFKLPQNNTPKLYNLAESLMDALPNIDTQTLAIQALLTNLQSIDEAILTANGGDVSKLNLIGIDDILTDKTKQPTIRCKRI